ncbi:hypothetical protein ACWXVT_00900 [Mycoplasma sp. 1573]
MKIKKFLTLFSLVPLAAFIPVLAMSCDNENSKEDKTEIVNQLTENYRLLSEDLTKISQINTKYRTLTQKFVDSFDSLSRSIDDLQLTVKGSDSDLIQKADNVKRKYFLRVNLSDNGTKLAEIKSSEMFSKMYYVNQESQSTLVLTEDKINSLLINQSSFKQNNELSQALLNLRLLFTAQQNKQDTSGYSSSEESLKRINEYVKTNIFDANKLNTLGDLDNFVNNSSNINKFHTHAYVNLSIENIYWIARFKNDIAKDNVIAKMKLDINSLLEEVKNKLGEHKEVLVKVQTIEAQLQDLESKINDINNISHEDFQKDIQNIKNDFLNSDHWQKINELLAKI